jgi:hypothetical protein
MKYFSKFILAAILLLVTTIAYAQSGIFYDRTVRGEGITVFEHEGFLDEEVVDFRTVYFYTYGDVQCNLIAAPKVIVEECVTATATATATAICPDSVFWPHEPLCDPVVVEVTEIDAECAIAIADSLIANCDIDGQRWFFGSDPINKDGDSIGKFYITEGLNFPECVPSLEPFEEDVDICADVDVIGTYILRPAKVGGFHMWVESNVGNHIDPLFDHAYEFTTLLAAPN